jgi:hypothetical protein
LAFVFNECGFELSAASTIETTHIFGNFEALFPKTPFSGNNRITDDKPTYED